MRYLAFFCLLALTACNTSTETTSSSKPAPDRAAAAAEGHMSLTPAAIKPVVAFEYEDILWGFRFLPDGRMIATDKSGKLLIVDKEGKGTEITEGVPAVRFKGQAGLLDVLLSQDFATDRMVYLTWSKPRSPMITRS